MPKFNPNPSNLEKARREAGLTRKELAIKTGISYRTIECYEQKKNDINMAAASTLRSLSEALGVPMDKIMND